MESSLKNKLKSLSKDESSFEELRDLFDEIQQENNETKKHLHLLEEAIGNDYDSILITEANLDKPGPKIVYVNEGFTKITGYSREDVLGKTPRILQGPKTDRATLDRLKKRLQNGRSFFGQAVNYRKDGTEFVNQWDIHPLTDEEGNLTHWVSYQHDISERKRAEKTVVNTHAEFDDLKEKSKCTLIDVALDGRIISANKSFRNLTGYEKDELHGKYIWELFPRKYSNSLKTRFDKYEQGSDFDKQKLQGIIKHKKGLPIQIEGLTNVLELKDRTLIRTEIKNISLQKRIMQSLEQRNNDYENIVDKATEFYYRVSLKNGVPVVDYVSDEFTKVTGLPAEQVLDSGRLEQFVHKDDVERVQECLKDTLDTNPCTCEYRIRTRDGSYHKVIDYCKPGTCKENGEKKCVRGAVSLVTEGELA